MLVCHCRGITDRDIRFAVRRGARTPDEVGAVCGAGTCCGGCRPAVRGLIRSESPSQGGLPIVEAPKDAI